MSSKRRSRACWTAGGSCSGREGGAFEDEFAAAMRRISRRRGGFKAPDAIELALRALDIGSRRRGHHPGKHMRADGGRDRARRCDSRPCVTSRQKLERWIRRPPSRQALSDKTRAVVPVHLYGQCADTGRDRRGFLRSERGIEVIEDCAQAVGRNCEGGRPAPSAELGCLQLLPDEESRCVGRRRRES